MMTPSDRIERAALVALHAVAPASLGEALRLTLADIGGTLVSVAGALPDSAIVLNRAIGFGPGDDLQRIRAAYDSAGVGRYFLSPGDGADTDRLLTAAGLRRARAWQKFRRDNGSVAPVETDLKLRQIGSEHGESFGRIVADAFDLGAEAVPWLAELPNAAGWHAFMAFDNAEPAGTGALYIEGDYAWTDFGATRPDYRRRGSQGALLAMRIAFALERGCREVFTCTGEAAPGDEQHSYRNILRLGFRKDYLRPNYEPDTV